MKLIKTMAYTSSSADNKGFQQKAEVKNSEDAIEFSNGIVMTLNSCLSHLFNNSLINYIERKKIQSKNSDIKFLKISEFENIFLSI